MLQEAAAYKKNWQKAQRARLNDGCVEDSFVYLHLNADDDVAHHVGMGDVAKRPWEMKNSRSNKHKNKTAKHGVRVELIADELTWENAQWWEVRWIKALKAVGYELTNLTDGGEGTKGFYPSEETREKLSISRLGEKNHNFGKTTPNEVREKIRNTLTGKKQGPNSPETIAKKSRASKLKAKILGTEFFVKKAILDWENRTPEERTAIANKGWETRRMKGTNVSPSSYLSEEQLSSRAKKGHETRRRNKLLKEGVE
jgi:hypothetical protein